MLRISRRPTIATSQYFSTRLQAIDHGHYALGNMLWQQL
jgi:hypothetical protein